MLEHVALNQTRFNTPGVAPDNRGILMGKQGAPPTLALMGWMEECGMLPGWLREWPWAVWEPGWAMEMSPERQAEIPAVTKLFRRVNYGQRMDLSKGVSFTFLAIYPNV